MKFKLFFILIIIFSYSLIVSAQTKEEPKKDSTIREKFDPSRNAAKDIKDAIKIAKKENKRIILDVGGEWCIWCKKLDKTFHENKDISDFLKEKYITVKINYSKENQNEKVLSKYPKITGYPHLFVLDKTGKLLQSQNTGDLESGDHHDPDKVMEFLKKWAK
jgi:thioredoxin-related protein